MALNATPTKLSFGPMDRAGAFVRNAGAGRGAMLGAGLGLAKGIVSGDDMGDTLKSTAMGGALGAGAGWANQRFIRQPARADAQAAAIAGGRSLASREAAATAANGIALPSAPTAGISLPSTNLTPAAPVGTARPAGSVVPSPGPRPQPSIKTEPAPALATKTAPKPAPAKKEEPKSEAKSEKKETSYRGDPALYPAELKISSARLDAMAADLAKGIAPEGAAPVIREIIKRAQAIGVEPTPHFVAVNLLSHGIRKVAAGACPGGLDAKFPDGLKKQPKKKAEADPAKLKLAAVR